jgi:hypothetical protein
MSNSRRLFIKSGTLAALTAGLALKGVHSVVAQKRGNAEFRIPSAVQRDPLMAYDRSAFEPYVNSIFQVPDALGRMISLTLVSVKNYVPPRTRITTGTLPPTDSFSLMFRAERSLPPFTSIHRMRHAALGDFNIFLTPRISSDGNWFYEAVFCRKL